MQRVTVSLDEETAKAFDLLIDQQGYQSRSEAVRDLVRKAIETRRVENSPAGFCVGSLSYVYNHRTRVLAQRLLQMQHDRHDLVVSATHAVLDHVSTFETMILKGPTPAVRALADAIRAERGVRFGAVNLVSVSPNDAHDETGAHHHHDHGHLSPPAG